MGGGFWVLILVLVEGIEAVVVGRSGVVDLDFGLKGFLRVDLKGRWRMEDLWRRARRRMRKIWEWVLDLIY